MATMRAINGLSIGSGYINGTYDASLFWVSNAIVVPSSFTSISYCFTITATDSSNGGYIDSYTSGVYFSTSSSYNEYGSTNSLTYANLQNYKGQTIYLFVQRSASGLGIDDLDYISTYSGSGYVAFMTSADTLTVTVKTSPPGALYTVSCMTTSSTAAWTITGAASGSYFKVPAGYTVNITVYFMADNATYYAQTDSKKISSSTTLYYFLRKSTQKLMLSSTAVSDCYMGSNKVKAIALGDTIVYVDPDLED